MGIQARIGSKIWVWIDGILREKVGVCLRYEFGFVREKLCVVLRLLFSGKHCSVSDLFLNFWSFMHCVARVGFFHSH